jgi:hypothetical protein
VCVSRKARRSSALVAELAKIGAGEDGVRVGEPGQRSWHRSRKIIIREFGLAAACDRWDNGDVRRLRKLDRTRPIDAAVALALAVQGATIEQPGSVYDSRGVIVL